MASKRDNPVARWRLNYDLPFHVLLWWYNSSGRELVSNFPTPEAREEVLLIGFILNFCG